MHTDLGDGEFLVLTSGANLQRGIEAVGGHLFLTTRRLIFEAHRLNAQTGRTVIPLHDIEAVWKCWTKLFGVIPVVPNSLAVATARGKTYRFVLYGRDKWLRLIRETQQDLKDGDEEYEGDYDERD
ncbi:MAG: hypothetical protein J0I06_10880 [Planctomycetes bacterium]|nr:hypothetical protein [Planctomycetota bacterium]